MPYAVTSWWAKRGCPHRYLSDELIHPTELRFPEPVQSGYRTGTIPSAIEAPVMRLQAVDKALVPGSEGLPRGHAVARCRPCLARWHRWTILREVLLFVGDWHFAQI